MGCSHFTTGVGSMSRIISIWVCPAKLQLIHHTRYQLSQKLHTNKVYIQAVKMMYDMSYIKLCLRRTFTRHKCLETICSGVQRVLWHHLPCEVFLIVNLFIELTGYSTQTTTNKYISEDMLTKYYAIQHIATQNYFDVVKTLISD